MNPFEFIETINDSDLDSDTKKLSPKYNDTPKVVLLRSIIGSLKIKHVLSTTEFNQAIDYIDLANTNAGIAPIEKLRNYISPDIDIPDLCTVFDNKKFAFQNASFYKRLVGEFTNFYYYQNKQSHTTAFVYIYRILETISYAFPLIYASKTEDFKGTYAFLKECIGGNKDKGELGFFKSFIKLIFKDDPLGGDDSSITIDIIGSTEEIQQSFFDAFKKACSDTSIFHPSDTLEPRKLSIKFTEFSSFIINLRNRFFHLFNSGQPNLESDEILDADLFFKMVNNKAMYWISLVLLEIVKHDIENYLPSTNTTTP